VCDFVRGAGKIMMFGNGRENERMCGSEKLSKKRRRRMAIFWGGEISI
jgi:hypothetical protein